MADDFVHSLWITVTLVAATVSVVEAVTEARRVRTARRRLTLLLPEARQEPRRPGLRERWRADGRWFRYIDFLEKGGRTLTEAHLVVKARRGPSATSRSRAP